MAKRRASSIRWKALAYFRDHERDINSVFGRRVPTRHMIGRMIRDCQLVKVPTRIKGHFKLELTPHGYGLLLSKHKQLRGRRKPSKPVHQDEASATMRDG
jgi:hypothetical protein